MGSIGRASKLLSKILFSPRVSDPRPPGSLQLLPGGNLGHSRLFPIGQRGGRGLPPWLPIGHRRRHSPSARALQAFPPEALCDWPLPAAARDPSSRARAACAGSLGQCSRPLQAESSSPALGEKLAWPRCLLTFSPGGDRHSFRAARGASGQHPCPAAPLPALHPKQGPRWGWVRAASRGVPAARRPLSPPAGDSLTQRVGRLVPCRRWSEDVRGEPGCRGNAVSSPGTAGRSEGPRPREPAPTPYPAATSTEHSSLSDPIWLFGAR